SSAAQIAAFVDSRSETCNQASVDTYRAYLESFAQWLHGRPISALTISAYLADMKARKRASATIGNAYRQIKTLCRWLVETEQLDPAPSAGPGRVRPVAQKRKRPKFYSEEQVVPLLVTAQNRTAEREKNQKWRPSKTPYLLRDARQSYALI